MAKLVLIKHAAPVKDDRLASRDWRLSDAGRANAGRLAELLRDLDLALAAVITSDEPKAHETGEIVGHALKVPVEIGDDLHEHDRSNVPVMPTRDFISSMALFFKEPHRLVLGLETADAARSRVQSAIDETVQSHAGKNIAIVSHGTVIALYASQLLREDPFQLWRRMGLPSYLVIDLQSRSVQQEIDGV